MLLQSLIAQGGHPDRIERPESLQAAKYFLGLDAPPGDTCQEQVVRDQERLHTARGLIWLLVEQIRLHCTCTEP